MYLAVPSVPSSLPPHTLTKTKYNKSGIAYLLCLQCQISASTEAHRSTQEHNIQATAGRQRQRQRQKKTRAEASSRTHEHTRSNGRKPTHRRGRPQSPSRVAWILWSLLCPLTFHIHVWPLGPPPAPGKLRCACVAFAFVCCAMMRCGGALCGAVLGKGGSGGCARRVFFLGVCFL